MDDQPSGPFRGPTPIPPLVHDVDEERRHARRPSGPSPAPETLPPGDPAAASTSPPSSPRSRPRSVLRRVLTWLVVLLLAGGLVGWLVWRAGQPVAPTGRFQSTGPMPVGVAKVETGEMPIVLSALGTATPLATVTVKTQISGQLIEVAFEEGQMVKKGDFLAQIDPRPYQVALAQAEGQLAKDEAMLRNAEIDLTRYRTLLAQNSIARQTVDTQAALVQQNRGTVQADQAQADAQKLNLTYARIVAPIGGRVGLRQVDPGNYVQANDANGIVVITQLQPISVIFTLPSDELPTLMQRMQAGAPLTVTAFDRTGTTRLDTGKLATVDNQIDTSTGMVKLRAVFDNAPQILFPNQFVNIQLLLDTLRGTPLVPVAAVQRGAPGTFVYVVKPDQTVAAQPVTLGPGNGQRVTVTKGLDAGQIVVIDGSDRLRDGAKVRIAGRGPPGAATAPATAPSATPDATPAEPGAAPAQRQRGQGRRQGSE